MSGRAGNKGKKDGAPAKREGAGAEKHDDHGPAQKSAEKAAGAKKGDKK